ncbi:MAG: DUF5060 domain-containing protein [Lachnotalea sp.]
MFASESEKKEVKGFYNGDGEYIIQFMPSFVQESLSHLCKFY